MHYAQAGSVKAARQGKQTVSFSVKVIEIDMKFRYRGGATGFLSRSVGRAVRKSVPDNQLGSCFVIALILAVITGSPIIALVVLAIILSILPVILLLAFLVVVGTITYPAIKRRYPQIFVSWFFLKENEPDGTILSLGEIQSRVKEFLTP